MDKKIAPAQDRGQSHPSVEIVAELNAADKELATLRALAALAGWRLDATQGPGARRWYILHRWGRAIDCADLQAVRAALVRVGVPV